MFFTRFFPFQSIFAFEKYTFTRVTVSQQEDIETSFFLKIISGVYHIRNYKKILETSKIHLRRSCHRTTAFVFFFLFHWSSDEKSEFMKQKHGYVYISTDMYYILCINLGYLKYYGTQVYVNKVGRNNSQSL